MRCVNLQGTKNKGLTSIFILFIGNNIEFTYFCPSKAFSS